MPLDASNIIQSNTGSFESTSGSVTLSATTAGNFVIIAATGGDNNDVNPTDLAITGFDKDGFAQSGAYQNSFFFTKVTSGGETSWTINVTNGPQQVLWMAIELEGADTDVMTFSGYPGVYLGDAENSAAVSVASQTMSTGTSGSYDTFGIALQVASADSGTIPDINGHTDNWQELASVSRTNGTRGIRMSVAARNYLSLTPLGLTVSISPSSPAECRMIAFTAANGRHAPVVRTMCGWEFGTASNLTQVGTSGDIAVVDEVVGTPEVVSAFKRTGSYSLKLSSSAATESVAWIDGFDKGLNGGVGQSSVGVAPVCFYFDTSLPGSDVELFSMEAASSASNSVKVWYRTASQKIGVKVGTGTEQLSDTTVAADKWIGVEIRYDPRTTTHTCDWRVDYDSQDATGPVEQTQATNTGMTAGVVTRFRLGWQTNTTATVYYDDVLFCGTRKAYPMGLVDIRPLRPDTGGTATITGSSANFNTFVSNGTMSAWNSSTAINALDEIPPTVGASADGAAQVTAAAANYARIPMETYTLAPDDVARGVRMYALGWAAGTQAASLLVQGYDGTNTHAMGGDSTDAQFDNSTYRWLTKTFRNASSETPYVVSQTFVDALAIEFGDSGDATPDIGLLFAMAELATQPATVYGVLDAEAGAFTVYVRQDPHSAAVASYLVTTPVGSRGATFTWTIDGTPGSQYVNPNTTYEHNVSATDIGQVTEIGLVPDPTA